MKHKWHMKWHVRGQLLEGTNTIEVGLRKISDMWVCVMEALIKLNNYMNKSDVLIIWHHGSFCVSKFCSK